MSKITEYDVGYDEGYKAGYDDQKSVVRSLEAQVGLLQARIRVEGEKQDKEQVRVEDLQTTPAVQPII